MIKVAMIGFGGIAQSAHLTPHFEIEKKGISKLVAVCDIRPEQFDTQIEINIGGSDAKLRDDIKRYTDWKEMLEKEDIDMVDICVPTFLHAPIAIGALEMGCHVLSEKPMSLNYGLCKEMYETADRVGKKLMIAQCCRFGPAYLYIKKLVDENTYGKTKSAVLTRLGAAPMWSWENWYMDENRSGGAILDLHIHDIDLIRYIWGNPNSVSCCAQDINSGKDIAHSRLMYDDFSVMAIGDWSREKVGFETGTTVSSEKATVIRKGGKITVYPRGDAEAFSPELPPIDSYQAEIEYFMDIIANNKENKENDPKDSALSVKLVNTLVESSEKNGEFVPFKTI